MSRFCLYNVISFVVMHLSLVFFSHMYSFVQFSRLSLVDGNWFNQRRCSSLLHLFVLYLSCCCLTFQLSGIICVWHSCLAICGILWIYLINLIWFSSSSLDYPWHIMNSPLTTYWTPLMIYVIFSIKHTLVVFSLVKRCCGSSGSSRLGLDGQWTLSSLSISRGIVLQMFFVGFYFLLIRVWVTIWWV